MKIVLAFSFYKEIEREGGGLKTVSRKERIGRQAMKTNIYERERRRGNKNQYVYQSVWGQAEGSYLNQVSFSDGFKKYSTTTTTTGKC